MPSPTYKDRMLLCNVMQLPINIFNSIQFYLNYFAYISASAVKTPYVKWNIHI